MLRISMVVVLTAGLVPGEDSAKKRDRPERRLQVLEKRAKRSPNETDAFSIFLQHETQRLLERTRGLTKSPYEFERMLEAVDDLLDAREDLAAAPSSREKEKSTRENTARRLERAYFRVQQGDYFAKLSGDKVAPEYVLRSRQLYQKGRAAYDRQDFFRALKLASAGVELVNVLENLAQAAVRKPEPPVLK